MYPTYKLTMAIRVLNTTSRLPLCAEFKVSRNSRVSEGCGLKMHGGVGQRFVSCSKKSPSAAAEDGVMVVLSRPPRVRLVGAIKSILYYL